MQFYSELLLGQYENQQQRGTPRGLGEEENMAYLNWGTEEQYQNILGNKGRKPIFKFRDKKAGNKFESNLRNKETQANI